MTEYTDNDYVRFSDKVEMPEDVYDTEACWLWRGAHHSKRRGYGKFRLAGKVMNAHKASYLLFNGEIKPGQVIGHLCNIESCVSPHHLVAQTQAENMQYCVTCGRHNSSQK